MNDDENLIMTEITHLRDAVEALTAGLMQMLGVLAQQTAMLREILAACTADEDDSPLVELLRHLAALGDAHTAALGRIEAAVMHAAR